MTFVFAMLAGCVMAGVAVLLGGHIAGFAAQAPKDYATGGPPMDIRAALAGPILCEGIIYGPTGRVSSRFVAQMNGVWDGDRGIISEHFQIGRAHV
jgi:hypothetical protein